MQKQNQKGFIIPLIITIVVIAILGTGGFFAYKQFSSPKQTASEEQNTTPKTETPADETVEPALSEVEGWKTYTNSEYGFEIKYPSTYIVRNGKPNSDFVANYVIDNGQAASSVAYSIWIRDNISSFEILKSVMQTTDTTIPLPGAEIKEVLLGGQKAVRFSYDAYAGGYTGTVYNTGVLLKNGLAAILSMEENANEAEYFNILSTFKFTNATDATTSLKTYTNTQYGFEIKYPSNNWSLLIDTPNPTPDGRLLYEMQISAIAESDNFTGIVQLYIQNGNVDSWLSNKATHTRETVYINGLRAEKFYFGRDPKTDTGLTYVFERNNLVYVINTAVVIGNKYGISETDISQILSTFKFTK